MNAIEEIYLPSCNRCQYCLSSKGRLSRGVSLTNKVIVAYSRPFLTAQTAVLIRDGETRKADSRGNLERSALSGQRKLLAPPYDIVHEELDRRENRAEEHHCGVRWQAERLLDPTQ